MIVKVQGTSERSVHTAGNPIKLSGFEDIDANTPIRAPGLDEHRERILAELMSGTGDYAPAEHSADVPVRAVHTSLTQTT
jgi:CoA:oxalate CoA-transferase